MEYDLLSMLLLVRLPTRTANGHKTRSKGQHPSEARGVVRNGRDQPVAFKRRQNPGSDEGCAARHMYSLLVRAEAQE